jgi:hypothetical protein
MKLVKVLGATSEIWQVFIQDSSSTTGAGLAGLAFNTGSLTAYYHRDTDTTATAITLATMTVGTFTSSGFKEIDGTNMPGWYQFCPPNAALASGAKSCAFHLKGAASMAPLPIEVQLTAANVDDSVRLGLTALPNAAAEASGGLYTRGTGAGQITQSTNGQIDVDAKKINAVSTSSVTTINANQGTTQPLNFTGTAGSALVKSDMVDVAGSAVSTSTAQIGVNAVNIGGTAQTGRDLGASVLLSSGTGTGQLDFTSGVVKSDAVKINAVSTSSVTTVNANVGTTQPTNFTGTAGSALVKSDTVDIAGAAVSTSSAQIGVNVVSFASGQAPLQPTVAGRTLDVSVGGEAGVDWANVGSPTTSLALTGTTIAVTQKVDVDTIKTNPVVNGGTLTFPTTATLASTTNITAGTITTVTNLTNAATAGDFTATMKTSIGTAVAASAVASVTGNVGGNVTGSVGSVATGGITAASIAANAITAAKIATDAIGAAQLAADAVDEIWDEVMEGSTSARQSLRLANSANGGILSGAATTTVDIRDLADTKNRVVATVDANGNRSAVTLDLS